MAERIWTNEQSDAIYTKWRKNGESCNILVNAAAGSGKTAVLVERIIKKLLPGEHNPNPVDLDRLLVVTFTNAAAAEMKDRISEALADNTEKAELEGDYILAEHFKRQSALVFNADITTIDAFCMKAVRENFHLLDIDPDFGIADNSQLSIIAEEAMEELFEECYENGNEDFFALSDMYSEGRDDTAVADIIYEVYDYTRSMPEPEAWLDEMAEMFLMKDGVENSPWVREITGKKNALCKTACDSLKTALEFMCRFIYGNCDNIEKIIRENPPGTENELQLAWGSCYEIIAYEYGVVSALLNADWDTSFVILNSVVLERWGKAASVKTKSDNPAGKEEKEYVKQFRDDSKKIIHKISDLITMPLSEIEKQMRERMYPHVGAIIRMVKGYDVKFTEKKRKKNVLDFSDVEHLCYELFLKNDEIRDILREKYEEILMDEYQDSNGLQEEIFQKISRGNNLFMVGDMKQSIYRFRRSDPTIFKRKSDEYINETDAADRKIVLSKNFRSRREVLESVNVIFEKIMSEHVGDVNYGSDERLNVGNESYENMNIGRCREYISECYVLETQTGEMLEEEEEIQSTQIEAEFIAKKILELKKSGYMVRDGNGYRPIQNRDITILMSSYKNVADTYMSVLNSVGIDCFAQSGGYFEKNEVRLVMSLMKLIQNPYQDIPLLGIMRSPIGGFSDDELVLIRQCVKGPFFEAIKAYCKNEDELSEKCREFMAKIELWRDYAKYMPASKLVWKLYEETGIYAFAGALFGGEEAQANLRLLFERAKQYEKSGFKGLFHFVKYMTRLEKKEEDLSSAKLIGEGHDVVKIMTIHKSKGLEFPVVFLAGCGKKFHEEKKKICLHKELGFGIDEINRDESWSVTTIAKNAVTSAERTESISEEERKLYVAMTRAKEKLIVVGTTNAKTEGIQKCEAKWEKMLASAEDKMLAGVAGGVNRFIDWIAPVARKAADVWHYETVEYEPLFEEIEEENSINSEDEIVISSFAYPFRALENIPSKMSVTELKNLENGNVKRGIELAKAPSFMESEKELSGAKKGEVIHLVMQKLEPVKGMDAEYVKGTVQMLVDNGELSEKEAENVDVDKIIAFYSSELGTRLLKSGKIFREANFETEVSLSDIKGFEEADEKILLQGIIDCYFEEDEEIVLIDYKSDSYNNPDELTARYKIQLDWYAYALEKITGKKVKEKFIYMFYGNDTVQC